MSVRVSIVDGAVGADMAPRFDGVGAWVRFDGVVRPMEDERPIVALDYEAYEPMATRELERLAEEVMRGHGLLGIDVWHSRGRVVVGACSFRLVVQGVHRAEALAAMDEFI